jgi:type III secretion protein K
MEPRALKMDASRLMRTVMELQLHPERHLHPSWLPPAWPARHRQPARWNAGGRAVLADCLRRWEPAPAAAERYDFQAPLRRLVLMDGASLRRLGAFCGFAAHRALFRQRGIAPLLKRQARRYGDDVPRFVQQRLPPLTQFAMNTAVIEARPHAAGAVVVERGCRLLLAALAGEGEPIVRSAQRKLPRRVSQRALPVLQAAQRAELSELMLLCLVPERLPEWDWLF